MNYKSIIRPILNDKIAAIAYFRGAGLLKTAIYCEDCNGLFKEVAYKRHKDGVAFRCYKSSCNKKNIYISIKKNSFFESFDLDLVSIFQVSYFWFSNQAINQIAHDFSLSKASILKINEFLRERCRQYFLANPIRLGGNGTICQIDESMFRYKQKYHTGRAPQQERWVFGIADTSSSPAKYFVTLVNNRAANTLQPIILQVVRPGTIVWSDEWRSYRSLSNLGTVNHTLNFINPETGVNTQTIESLWNKLKRRLKKMMGLTLDSLREHLIEWMWKDNIGKNDLQNLIDLMKI
jgi:hypothetical protein